MSAVLQQVPQISTEPFPIEAYEDVVWVEQTIEEKSKGGIILAASKERKLPAGRVVAVGPGRVFHAFMDASGHKSMASFVPTTTQVGDYVIFGRYQSGGEPLLVNGRRYLMCREGDLAGRSANGNPVEVRIALEE